MRRMLCTLLSGALRGGAGQLRMTSLPCCAPERDSVRCCTRSTGGSGGLRFPQPENTINPTVNKQIQVFTGVTVGAALRGRPSWKYIMRMKGGHRGPPLQLHRSAPNSLYFTECND